MSDENWIVKTIAPKSDQLNADDMITGPITVTIEDVMRCESTEQPVAIKIAGRQPYKPCKTMRRMLVSIWGDRAADWIGRQLTLVNDPDVKWGGVAVGGIRISAMSHIEQPVTLAMTVARGKRKPITVQPIVIATSEPPTFLDKWRASFAGASPAVVMDTAKEIARGYSAKDATIIDSVEDSFKDILDLIPEHYMKLLLDFAAAVRHELTPVAE